MRRIICAECLSVFIILCLCLIPKVCQGADKSLVLNLHFDKDAKVTLDSSGNRNNGKIVGPTWTADGKLGGAFRFNGLDNYIDCGKGESLNLGTSDFTLEAWIKTAAKNIQQTVIDSGDYYGKGCGSFVLQLSTILDCRYMSRTAKGKLQYATGTTTLTPVPLNDGRWHHIVAVIKRSHRGGSPRLFIDGVEDICVATNHRGRAASILLNNSDPLYIGASSPKRSNYFKGLIDEVKIYKRALSVDEVKAHYEKEKGTETQPPVVLSPKTEIIDNSGMILMYNNRISILFDKHRGLPRTVTLLPEKNVLMPALWQGSVHYGLAAKKIGASVESRKLIDNYQYHNLGKVTFTTKKDENGARVTGEIYRVDRNKNPILKISYTYSLSNNKPYIEAEYIITALSPFETRGGSFIFNFSGDTVVYMDETGYIVTKFAVGTNLSRGSRVNWKENIFVKNFWMVSRASKSKYSVGILWYGKSNLKNYRFTGDLLGFGGPELKGVVEKGAQEKAKFYIVGIRRRSIGDQRADLNAIRKLLNEIK